MLSHTSRFRGDVAAVLNRLTGEGVISSYRTNIEGQQRPKRLQVAVQGPDNGAAEDVEARVKDGLASLHNDVAVALENKPTFSSKLADDLGGFA
jgi:hypothetical protein